MEQNAPRQGVAVPETKTEAVRVPPRRLPPNLIGTDDPPRPPRSPGAGTPPKMPWETARGFDWSEFWLLIMTVFMLIGTITLLIIKNRHGA